MRECFLLLWLTLLGMDIFGDVHVWLHVHRHHPGRGVGRKKAACGFAWREGKRLLATSPAKGGKIE